MDLKVGDTFVDTDEVFIKCRYVGENIVCPRCNEMIDTDDEMSNLALMLSTGELVMDVGTILDGNAAVNEGLIDSIGNLKDAMSYLYHEINKRS